MSKDDAKRLGKFVEDYINTLPIAKYVSRAEVIHHSAILPLKGSIEQSPYDMLLYTHYNDDNNLRMNVVIGLVFNEERDQREAVE